ncbi:transmembrane glycosyltransferase [Pedobacter yulinensis]|uniref:Transmembrane glycosyltransferase n=1 Tax=Pedobacter yulinensis TaxID=2126353 RepID=A0A2T3HJ65_9SPHI|nr:transmembrane glycosyltransferase [Pedobacter yulinensis]
MAFCLVLQLYYTLFVHLRLLRQAPVATPVATKPLSVVICARNEAPNLEKFLPAILTQDYPDYEVIVVNDRSWDGTGDLLEQFAASEPRLRIVTIGENDKFRAGKKFAVTMGIKAARHEWLVFTDADCLPASDQWLRHMQPPVNPQTEILLGYSPYLKKSGLLNALIRFETFFTAVNYLSFALKGMPYMAVGRNMAYQKSLFFKSKGFAAHMHIPSGDDDLFVNANATKHNTKIRIEAAAHVWSEPKTTWLSYLRQKKRHVGAGRFYKKKHQFILSTQIISQLLFYVFLVAAICLPATRYAALGVLAVSLIVRCAIYPRLLSRLNCGGLRWWFPLLDPMLFLFLTFNGLIAIFIKKVQWK